MENKINIAELLKDCPKGMELDCTMYDNVEFDGIVDNEYLPIRCRVKNPNGGYNVYNFTKYGCWIDTTFAKCVIFPKGKTTWEGFQRHFKDGDILTNKRGCICIYKGPMYHNELFVDFYCGYRISDEAFVPKLFKDKHFGDISEYRLASEEEKEKLFKVIKDNGYKWNADTKTLEKLVEPKFKVGDRIKAICNNCQYDIKELTDTHYNLVEVEYKLKYTEPISEDKNWELVPEKFDITKLKPFESRVLVRDTVKEIWKPDFFGCLYDSNGCPYMVVGGIRWKCCIPYEGNEHLLGTTNDCNEYFKTWE